MSDEALKKAIALIRAGKTEAARPILAEILQNDPDHEQAWLWISKCFPEVERKKYCFERVLKVNPENPIARKALKALETGLASVENPVEQSQARKPQPRKQTAASQQPYLSESAQKKQRRLGGLLSFLFSLLMVAVVALAVWGGLYYLLPRDIPITHAELKTHLTALNVFCGSVETLDGAASYAYVMRCSGYYDEGAVQVTVDVYSEDDAQEIDLILVYATQQSGEPQVGVMGEALAQVAALPYRNASPEQASNWVRSSFPLLLANTAAEEPVAQFGRVQFHLASLTPERKYLAIGEGNQ